MTERILTPHSEQTIVERILAQPASEATPEYWRELARGLLTRAKAAEERLSMPCWKCEMRKTDPAAPTMSQFASKTDYEAHVSEMAASVAEQDWQELREWRSAAHPHLMPAHLKAALSATRLTESHLVNAAFERAAFLCERTASLGYDGHGRYYEMGALDCARKIREAKEPV